MNIKEILERVEIKGLTYLSYKNNLDEYLNTADTSKMSDEEKGLFDYTSLNKHRSSRVEKIYKVSDEIKEELLKISKPQTWMVITEPWCGDSSQILPHLAAIAEVNKNIKFRILLRDQNLDVMNDYLTNNTQSIPILVLYDNEGMELAKWGPRPKGAIQVIKDAKEEGLLKQKMYEKLHLWYAQNKGKEIEEEIIEIIRGINK